MTWRAFIIGIFGVLGLCLLVPVNDYAVGNTYLTGTHFPVGVFFFLLVLTLLVNGVIKLVRSGWALRQSELMLVWCMMLVSSTVPASGLMRYWFTTAAAAPYLAQRADLFWEDDVLKEAPEGILLSKDLKSMAAKMFYHGTREGETVRVPWGRWTKVIVNWAIFIWLYYLATFFVCGILRRQWVEAERLIFPVARVPLEFTEGSGQRRLLPALMRHKAFLFGVTVSLIFGLIRLAPLFFGAEEGWMPRVPINQVFSDTEWWRMQISDGWIFPIGIGFAFLVPSDISLSMWLFYVLMCGEILTAHYIGRPLEGGPWGAFMWWQQAGAFIAVTIGMVWMARRHLWAVVRKAVGRAPGVDDSDEPIGYRLGFWGLVASAAGMIAWYVYFGMSLWVAVSLLALVLSVVLVHARLVAQGGLFFTQQSWNPPDIIHGLSGGRAFSAAGAVVAQVQHAILTYDAREILSPHAMNSLRISSVFQKHRRLFLPIMLTALLVGMIASGYSTMRWVYYEHGALNIPNTHSTKWYPIYMFNRTHAMIANPGQSAQPHYGAMGFGAGLMFALIALRSTFYWWPIHSLGIVVASSWCMRQLWFSFLLGWLAKVLILKFGSGGILRGARTFFLGVIIAESTMVGISTFVSLLTGIRTGYIFLSG
ncbi:MAG: hypothetical protein KAX19_14235 [Candidatus Brocadiae bacterium]|nr:hypothetical protein [Candidatus Brocadiia bacterium]